MKTQNGDQLDNLAFPGQCVYDFLTVLTLGTYS